MPIYERSVDRGARRARYLVARTSAELLAARRAAGLSQREVARQARISHSKVGRVERGLEGQLTFEVVAKIGAVLGLQFNATLHPSGEPVRDAAHIALLERFRARLAPNIRWRTEVPIPIQGDRRSADAVIAGVGFEALVEAETRIDDVQALERRLRAKQRDLAVARVVLLVADTRHNRRIVGEVVTLQAEFPVSTRACLSALARGNGPPGDSLVFL